MASSDPKGAVSASTRNSPGAPAESPVERRTVQETGRVSDRVHTHQTTAAHAAQDRSQRDPPRTTPPRGPELVRRGACPAPLPRQGPAAGTKSPNLGRPPRAPRRHPVKPGATAPGLGEGTTAMRRATGAPRATGPDEERRTNAGPRGTPERHASSHNVGMRTGTKPQRPPSAANPGSAHKSAGTAARTRSQGQPGPHARTPRPRQVGSGPRPHARKDEKSGSVERPSPDAPHPGKRRPPRAPSCRPGSAQSQLARARAVGLVTGTHARTPRTESQWVVGPGRTPQRTRGRGWESAQPRTPHSKARGAPPGHPYAAPTARKASWHERALWGW